MKKFLTSRSISTRSGPNLSAPIGAHCAAVYYWQPGYTLNEKTRSSDGKETNRKVFKPTSTVEMAVSFLTKHYGPKEFIKHKQDIHPGHVSLAAQDRYLSIGTEDDLQSLSFKSEHKLVFSDNLSKEIFAFGRTPHCVDLHSLNLKEIVNFIDTFKKAPGSYSLLGRRLNFAQGESCATIVHECLLQGGFGKLLTFVPDKIFSERLILTPASLKDYCEIARSSEHGLFPDAKKLSAVFQEKFKTDMKEFQKEFARNISESDSARATNSTTFKS